MLQAIENVIFHHDLFGNEPTKQQPPPPPITSQMRGEKCFYDPERDISVPGACPGSSSACSGRWHCFIAIAYPFCKIPCALPLHGSECRFDFPSRPPSATMVHSRVPWPSALAAHGGMNTFQLSFHSNQQIKN